MLFTFVLHVSYPILEGYFLRLILPKDVLGVWHWGLLQGSISELASTTRLSLSLSLSSRFCFCLSRFSLTSNGRVASWCRLVDGCVGGVGRGWGESVGRGGGNKFPPSGATGPPAGSRGRRAGRRPGGHGPARGWPEALGPAQGSHRDAPPNEKLYRVGQNWETWLNTQHFG